MVNAITFGGPPVGKLSLLSTKSHLTNHCLCVRMVCVCVCEGVRVVGVYLNG